MEILTNVSIGAGGQPVPDCAAASNGRCNVGTETGVQASYKTYCSTNGPVPAGLAGFANGSSEKLSAGDDVGIAIAVLALIAIVSVIGLYMYRSTQEATRTMGFVGGDDV